VSKTLTRRPGAQQSPTTLSALRRELARATSPAEVLAVAEDAGFDGPPILIGGNGARRTLPLAARYASEWNAVYIPPAEFEALNTSLDAMLSMEGRRPSDVRRSLMTGCVFGRDRQEVDAKVTLRTGGKRSVEQLREHGVVAGTPEEIQEQLAAFSIAGVQRIMLQWLDLDDLDGLQALAEAVLRN